MSAGVSRLDSCERREAGVNYEYNWKAHLFGGFMNNPMSPLSLSINYSWTRDLVRVIAVAWGTE